MNVKKNSLFLLLSIFFFVTAMFYLLTRLQYDLDFKFVGRMEISIPSEKLKSVLEEKIDNCQPQEALVSKQETATILV